MDYYGVYDNVGCVDKALWVDAAVVYRSFLYWAVVGIGADGRPFFVQQQVLEQKKCRVNCCRVRLFSRVWCMAKTTMKKLQCVI